MPFDSFFVNPLSESADADSLSSTQAQYLENYRKGLESELSSITNKAINQWLKESDQAYRDAVNLLIDEAKHEIERQILNGLANSDGGGASGSDFALKLLKIVSEIAAAEVNKLLFASETSVSSSETVRSRDATTAFRQSRSQQQAAAARHALRGQRNL